MPKGMKKTRGSEIATKISNFVVKLYITGLIREIWKSLKKESTTSN
jgi:hypothetical protein